MQENRRLSLNNKNSDFNLGHHHCPTVTPALLLGASWVISVWERERETGSATEPRNTIPNASQNIYSKQAVKTGWTPQAVVICTEFATLSFSEYTTTTLIMPEQAKE